MIFSMKDNPYVSWVLPIFILMIVFTLGVMLLRPGETANKSDYGTQVGVGGGPPMDVDVTLTPTPTIGSPVAPSF
jgi:hypothetical protein